MSKFKIEREKNMQVKCYDCGRLVPQGEAIKQSEGSGNVGGGGYSRRGWGAGGGTWKSEGKSYWLCILCDRKRVENRRFWQWAMLAVALGIILIVAVVYLFVGKGNN